MQINPFDILKNAQKIQEQMGMFQEKIGSITAAGSSGGGMVRVELTGRMEVVSVTIAPEAAAAQDVQMLEDLIAAAFTSAVENVKEALSRELGGAVFPPGLL
ncbi:MAG: YbaB/EbfC family nucleoid-associated protein [Spirochaetaceae bacterium]|jgi:DNA-binding YbaB/EbfC family protein|nr:YbaB/EbfC family nucleoid-associated protein [Spirochaetaceae bacterium]